MTRRIVCPCHTYYLLRIEVVFSCPISEVQVLRKKRWGLADTRPGQLPGPISFVSAQSLPLHQRRQSRWLEVPRQTTSGATRQWPHFPWSSSTLAWTLAKVASSWGREGAGTAICYDRRCVVSLRSDSISGEPKACLRLFWQYSVVLKWIRLPLRLILMSILMDSQSIFAKCSHRLDRHPLPCVKCPW